MEHAALDTVGWGPLRMPGERRRHRASRQRAERLMAQLAEVRARTALEQTARSEAEDPPVDLEVAQTPEPSTGANIAAERSREDVIRERVDASLRQQFNFVKDFARQLDAVRNATRELLAAQADIGGLQTEWRRLLRNAVRPLEPGSHSGAHSILAVTAGSEHYAPWYHVAAEEVQGVALLRVAGAPDALGGARRVANLLYGQGMWGSVVPGPIDNASRVVFFRGPLSQLDNLRSAEFAPDVALLLISVGTEYWYRSGDLTDADVRLLKAATEGNDIAP